MLQFAGICSSFEGAKLRPTNGHTSADGHTSLSHLSHFAQEDLFIARGWAPAEEVCCIRAHLASATTTVTKLDDAAVNARLRREREARFLAQNGQPSRIGSTTCSNSGCWQTQLLN